jgi:hypothetical protein
LLIAYGAAVGHRHRLAKQGRGAGMLGSLVGDFSGMPPVMKQLALVQFFSWSALFIMWINTTPVVAQNFFGTTDPDSPLYPGSGQLGRRAVRRLQRRRRHRGAGAAASPGQPHRQGAHPRRSACSPARSAMPASSCCAIPSTC